MNRLRLGMDFLGIQSRIKLNEIEHLGRALILKNELSYGALRFHMSRGSGPRGLKTASCEHPLLLIQTFPIPIHDGSPPMEYRIHTCRSIRLPIPCPIHEHKTANRLPWILAASEAEKAGFDDALILNTNGEVTECSAGNLFWFENDRLITPDLDTGALPGITRKWILNLAEEQSIPSIEKRVKKEDLISATGMFMTLSTRGIIRITRLDETEVSAHPGLGLLWAAYMKSLESNGKASS